MCDIDAPPRLGASDASGAVRVPRMAIEGLFPGSDLAAGSRLVNCLLRLPLVRSTVLLKMLKTSKLRVMPLSKSVGVRSAQPRPCA